jgi:hypothetical protein
MENLSKINLSEITINTGKEYNFKSSDQEPCIICQKPLNVSDKTKYVHMLTSGELINCDDHADSQGFFPIGNDCCKRLPKNFIFSC